MSFLRSPNNKAPQSAAVVPQYTGMQIQTSTNALPIAICYGLGRLAPNLVFYQNFQAHPIILPSQGSDGKVTWTFSGYWYTADLIMALCEGTISGIGQLWRNDSVWGANAYSTYGAAIPSSGPYTVTVPYAANFTNTVQVKYASTGLLLTLVGSSPAAGQYSVSAGVYTFNSADAGTNVWITYQYSYKYDGAGLPTAGTNVSLASLNITIFNGAQGQAGWSYLQTTYPSQYLPYSGTAYAALPGFNLGSNASIGTMNFEVKGAFYATGGNGIDADPALVIADFLTNPQYGCRFPGANLDATSLIGASGDSSLQTYCKATGICFSPLVNQQESGGSILQRWTQLLITGAVWSGDRLRFIPYGDQDITANGVTWVAPTTPVYALTDSDFIYSPGEDPVQVSRIDPFTIPNFQWLEVVNRAGFLSGQGQPQYQATPVSVHDQAAIEQFGLLVGSSITAHEICDLAVAQTVAQTLLQRQIYVRQHFQFKLSWEYCLLDPMDVVSITDANLGLSAYPVRIVDIEEDDNGVLTITAEELATGVSTSNAYTTSGSGGGAVNAAYIPGSVNTPLIFEPPYTLTNNIDTIWLGASASVSGAVDPNWGGANVYVSVDNSVFVQIATISKTLTQGTLTSPLASATGWDTTNTLAVDLTISNGSLTTTTDAAAQAGQTLCLVDNELLAFATATLTATNKYNLTRLQRGLNNSCPSLHTTSTPFYYIDGAVSKWVLPQNYIGQTLYFKFQSVNIFGGGAQDISTCTVYTYTPTGNGVLGPVFQGLQLHQDEDWGSSGNTVVNREDWGTTTACTFGRVVDVGALT